MPRRVCEVLIVCRLLAVSSSIGEYPLSLGLASCAGQISQKTLSYSLSHGCRRVTATVLRESNLGFQQSAPLCMLSYFLCLEFCINSISCTLYPGDALLFFTFFILGNKPQEFYGGRKSCIMGQGRMASSDLTDSHTASSKPPLSFQVFLPLIIATSTLQFRVTWDQHFLNSLEDSMILFVWVLSYPQ